MAEMLPKNNLILACLYTAAEDERHNVRLRYADIMKQVLKLDEKMREEDDE